MPTFGLTPKETTILMAGPRRMADALRIMHFAATKKNGTTCDECASALGIKHHTCSPRFSELEASGCLIDTGKRSRTSSGSYARLLKLAPNADFRTYMIFLRKPRHQPRARKKSLLSACETFLAGWSPTSSKERQAELIRTLVSSLIEAAKVPV